MRVLLEFHIMLRLWRKRKVHGVLRRLTPEALLRTEHGDVYFP